MIDRRIARIAATVVCLGGASQASLAGTMSDLSCSAREGNASLLRRACSAGSKLGMTPNSGICIAQAARFRPSATPSTAVAMTRPAHQNLCLKANSSAPLSHLALEAQR
jgi:hypothetical protein